MFRDLSFLGALGAAIIFWVGLYWFSDPLLQLDWPRHAPWTFLSLVLLYPVMEEILFRGLLQEALRTRLPPLRWGPVSVANLCTSILFTALHFLTHPLAWALSILLPSLGFGYFMDKYRDLRAPVFLHVFYNAGYFWLFAPQTV